MIIARRMFVMLKSTGKKLQGQRAWPKIKTWEDLKEEKVSS